MKVFLIQLFKVALTVIYAPLKLLKTKNQIVYLSRQSDDKSLDMKLLEKELLKISPDTKQVFRLRMIPDGIIPKARYAFALIGDMYYLATSKGAILDTYSITVSCLKHKSDLKVFQIWHALGALKKFGLQSVGTKEGRDEGVSRAMCMHKNYDYIIAPSEAAVQIYSEAFGYQRESFEIMSLPRVDEINSPAPTAEFYSENPNLADKKIVLYLPTFREREAYVAEELKAEFADNAMEGYQLIISTHPLFSKVKRDERFSFNGDFGTYDLMKLADVIVTDYSACAFEASLLLKPLYFFVPDLEKYALERGVNIDLRAEMPSATFESAEELAKAIKKGDYDINMLYSFREKYVANNGSANAERLARFIADKTGV